MGCGSSVQGTKSPVATPTGDAPQAKPIAAPTTAETKPAETKPAEPQPSPAEPKPAEPKPATPPKEEPKPVEPPPVEELEKKSKQDDSYPPNGLSAILAGQPEWIKLGCGDSEYYCIKKGAVFPHADCPDTLPDLSEHCNFMTETLRANPEIYENLKDKRTSLGVGLAKCIKTGMDNKGHPHIKTVGLVAGDEESYTLFKDLFDPVIEVRHGGYKATDIHPTNLNLDDVDKNRLDPTGKYVLTSRVRTGRSVKGFRLPPACTFEERRILEALCVKGLLNLTGDLKGDYYPLHGSRSYAPKVGGMDAAKQEELLKAGNLFQEPDSTLLLASGCGRHWPDARGIYHNEGNNCFVWVNEEDHIRIVSMEKGDDIQGVFARFVGLCNGVQEVLKAEGYDFMHTEHHGYLLTCPSNLGTGMRAGCLVKIPLVSAQPDFKERLKKMGLQARGQGGVDAEAVGGVFDISNADRLGKSEVDLLNAQISGIRELIKSEQELEAKQSAPAPAAPVDDSYPPNGLASVVAGAEEWIKLGCGDAEYYCEAKSAVFPGDKCPDEQPDLSEHNNFMAETLRANPEIWGQLKDKKTSLGVGLAKCIKTGMDNKGHPHIKTVGLVAGDEESYTVFKDLFDPVIEARHGGYAHDAIHPTNLDLDAVNKTKVDPTGKYILTSRVRTGRSIRGFCLPPANSFEERRKLEALVVKALLNLKDDLKGEYFPLHGSRSYEPKIGGMNKAKQDELLSAGNLFQEPDSTLLLSSGCGRHWPDARGIYHNDDNNCFVWVNEEDHVRVVSMEKGDDIQGVFARFVRLCNGVQEVLKAEGYDFMHSSHLGYILTCPSNLGTGMRAGCLIKIPLVSALPDFKERLGKMGLQARGQGGVDAEAKGGIYDISNADRIGKSEVDLLNAHIAGLLELIKMEQELEATQGGGEAPAVEPAADSAAPAAPAAESADSYPPTGLAPGLANAEEWIKLGCGDAEYYCEAKGAMFPAENCPDEQPDLSEHNNFMAETLRANPDIWPKLKDLRTSKGVGLAKCIKTGIDNKGHPFIKTVGLVAGDEESYTLFKDLFDPVIDARHGGYGPDRHHPTNLDLDAINKTKIDPEGKYILTSRVRTGRSIRGFRLPPANTFEERRELERLSVKGLLKLTGDLKGDYFPLNGSRSYEPKMGGMDETKQRELLQAGNLFQEPDSTLLLASGCGRHWPDARGIYHNDDNNCFVWLNEEDHIRIVSMEKGDDIQGVFARFIRLCNGVQEVLKEEGYDFMHSEHLGYILTCPSNLGTGMRAGCLIKIPLVSALPDFKERLNKMELQARGQGGVDAEAKGGIYDISNADRLGKSEVDLLNKHVSGLLELIALEKSLEAEAAPVVEEEAPALVEA
eukprot:GEMP01001088.1.p1 GENE.GEMP01001088.1~~GEMP01001088.1.p1  ORF type:complete len:1365 (+),score=290.19 GEMP01001088.1:378-4472(+)